MLQIKWDGPKWKMLQFQWDRGSNKKLGKFQVSIFKKVVINEERE